jgi:hypothetical protein
LGGFYSVVDDVTLRRRNKGRASAKRISRRRWARADRTSARRKSPLGQIFNVFTLRDGRIVRIDDYRGRREALTAAGVAEDADWRELPAADEPVRECVVDELRSRRIGARTRL